MRARGRAGQSRGLPWSAVGRPLALPRAGLALLWRRRATRIALLAVVIALPVLAGAFMLLRHSSFVAVQRVQLSGVHGAEAPAIEAALVSAAHHMSTLDVRTGALRAAVAQFPVVRAVYAHPRFPHGLTIDVVEQLPVAALVAGGARTAVAADGVVLGPALLSSSLPTLGGWSMLAPGAHLHDRGLLAAVVVLGAAPRSLAKQVARAYSGPEGLTVAMRNGLVVYFGDASRPHAKWDSLARVLADQSSAGALYIDVRLPARPAAGFAAGGGPASTEAASTEASGSQSTGTTGSPVGTLAEGLSAGTPAGSSSGNEPASEPSSQASGTESSGATERSEAPSSEAHESPSSAGTEAAREAPAAGG